jgi:hypothetical protein
MKRTNALLLLFAVPLALLTAAPRSRITVEYFIKGTYRIILCEVTPERLFYRTFSTNDEPPQTKIDRRLNPVEAAVLRQFLASFPLAKLDDRYVNTAVQGSIHTVLTVTAGGVQKKILLYYRRQPDVLRLLTMVNGLLPAELALDIQE